MSKDIIKVMAGVRCPHCHVHQQVWVDMTRFGKVKEQLLICDPKDGCGSTFAVRGGCWIELMTSESSFS